MRLIMYYVISPDLFVLRGDASQAAIPIRVLPMSIDYWIDRLEDPFEMFALVHVLRSLGALADESESSRAERAGWWGVSPKYYSVEDEHDIEVVEHLIGPLRRRLDPRQRAIDARRHGQRSAGADAIHARKPPAGSNNCLEQLPSPATLSCHRLPPPDHRFSPTQRRLP